jgi:hypothetical protein
LVIKDTGQLQVPSALPLNKQPLYPLNRKSCGTVSRCGRFEGKTNLLPPTGNAKLFLRLPSGKGVTIETEPSVS